METIELRFLFHKATENIAFYFNNNVVLNKLIRQMNGIKWSRTHRCWYIGLTEENYRKCKKLFEGKALLEVSELRRYLLARKKVRQNREPEKNEVLKEQAEPGQFHKNRQPTNSLQGIREENMAALQEFKQLLVLKGYSSSTLRTYTNEFIQFLSKLKDERVEAIAAERLKSYLQYCHQTLKLSESTIHSRMNAIKFYYEQVLGKEKFFWQIPRPKRPLLLPKVFSKEDVAKLINSIKNHKHKTIIMLTYACGLRVSEVVSLKVKDIDGQRKLLFVRKAKGKKDRVVSLSPAILIMLREYYKHYKPKDYLFEGQHRDEHLSVRSIQLVLKKAKQKAGIQQDGNMHVLRHSFATHLLDKGIDVVFIQKLLGHNDIKTTLRYLHVTNKDVVKILSPLEDIEGLLKK